MSRKNSFPPTHNTSYEPETTLASRHTRRNALLIGIGILATGISTLRGISWLNGQEKSSPQPANPNKLSDELRSDLGVKAAALDKQITGAYYNSAVKGVRFSNVELPLSSSLILHGIGAEIPAGSTDTKEPYGAYRLETYFHNAQGGQVGDRVSVDESLSKDNKSFFKVKQTVITRETDKSVSLVINERNTLLNPTNTIITKLNTNDPTMLEITHAPFDGAGPVAAPSKVPVPPGFAETAFQQAMHTIALATQPTPAPVGGNFTPYKSPEL